MALSANTVFEIRANGVASNGGGFVTGASGTDHSQQDAVWSTRTDLVIDAVTNTDITSVGDAFAADDVGNLIQITAGTGFTVGYYQVVSVTVATARLDRAVGTVGSTGGTGHLGGAGIFEGGIFAISIPGNKYWVKADGTHTLTANVNPANDGDASNPIMVEGYNTTRGDRPVGTSRPLIAAGANLTSFDDFWQFRHFRVTTTSTDGFRSDLEAVFENVKVENTSGTSSREGILAGNTDFGVYACEGVSTNGFGFLAGSGRGRIFFSYFHDSVGGAEIGALDDIVFYGNVFDSNTTGLNAGAGSIKNTIIGNVFYNNAKGIQGSSTSTNFLILNNIFSTSSTAGVEWGASGISSVVLNYNIWNGNTTDVTNVVKGANDITSNPLLNDPANGDFTVQSGSPALDATKISMGTWVGVTGAYKWNIGVDQDDNAAAGSGGGMRLAGHGGLAA